MKQQQQSPTLDARISQALGDGRVSVDDLQVLIPEAEAGIEEADAVAARERDESLDPHTAPQAAEQAAHRASVAELQRGRYQVALPRLREKLAKALEVEHEDRWHADANKIEVRAAAAVEEFNRCYAEFSDRVVAALYEIEAVNEEISRINGSAPDGVHHRISRRQHVEGLVIPGRWPPRKPSVAEQYAATMFAPAHPGADWAAAQEARAAAAREAAARHAKFYEQQTKMQEDRWNREERERVAQSQQRG